MLKYVKEPMAPFFVLEDFIQYLEVEKRYSPHTVVAYKNDLIQFADFSGCQDIESLKEVRGSLVRSWIVSLVETGVENKSINRKLSSLRTFFKWLQKMEFIVVNPLLKLNGPKNSKRLPSFARESDLAVEKIEPLFSSDFSGQRDQLIVELLYQTGIRLSELIELRDGQIHNNTVKVIGKRNKERLIPISKELNQFIERFRLLKVKNGVISPYLLTLENGNKLYPKFVYRKINSYLRKVTNLEKCSPHVLRHTFATHMLNNGAGLETLKDLLGHANLSATQVYTHNSFAQLTNIYSLAHPRGAKND